MEETIQQHKQTLLEGKDNLMNVQIYEKMRKIVVDITMKSSRLQCIVELSNTLNTPSGLYDNRKHDIITE